MDQDQLGQLVIRAFNAAVDRDLDRIADALDTIGNTGDPFDMYAACCGFAEIGKGALKKIYGDRAPRPDQGDMWVIEELQPGSLSNHPPKAFAARFLIAYCNDDRETPPALFRAALEAGPEQYVDSLCALLADVAGIARLALDQTA
ncbi:hypothetical protein ELQ39_15800 [Streptomyces sp. GB4-14]|uniref:hypothetical protein n=1 Tax=Streptomyces sp. GB4-14 TaxID=2498703 RepID=UPI001F5F336D|nr:hypothetical protein [Streptomyces sp. GB4-14]